MFSSQAVSSLYVLQDEIQRTRKDLVNKTFEYFKAECGSDPKEGLKNLLIEESDDAEFITRKRY